MFSFSRFFIVAAAAVMMMSTTTNGADIQSHTRAGQRLMSKARLLDNNNNADMTPATTTTRDLAEDYYTMWMTKYSMKFDGCHSVPQFERDEGLRSVLLAKFKMCPSDNCGSCK